MTQIEFVCKNVEKAIRHSNSRNPFEICSDLNIHIYYKDLGSKLKAYYFSQSRIKNIIINSNVDPILQSTLCAHELGHSILHDHLASLNGFHDFNPFNMLIPSEYEANLFAAELLIPDDELAERVSNDNSSTEMAPLFEVPLELIYLKCKILKAKGFNVNFEVLASDFLKN